MRTQGFWPDPALNAGGHIQTNKQDHHKRQAKRERSQGRAQRHILRQQRANHRGNRAAQRANVVGKAQTRRTLVGIEIAADEFG